MKRTPLRKGKSKLKKHSKEAIKKWEEKKKKQAEMDTFFLKIWLEVPPGERMCQSCGIQLNFPIRNYYFDHLIEKSKRPDLALERENIFLCCLECHSKKTDGHPTPKHQEAIEKAKERFGIS